MTHADRRTFLRDAALVTAGAVGGLAGGMFPIGLPAIEPIRRIGGPNFKFSLAAYSYRRLLTGDAPQLTLDDFVVDCAKMGLEGTELTSYYFPPEPSPDYLRHLKHLTFKLGLDISGTAIRNDFCYPSGPDRDREIAHVKRWIDYAEMLGAPVIRIFSGRTRGDQSPEEAHRLAVEGIEVCCDYAGRHGVFLALENHGGLTTTTDGILSLIRDVKSPWFGANLDSGNFRTADVYSDIAKLAPYALNVQVKVVVHPGGGQKVPADYGRLAEILRSSGYRGYIVLEYEESGDPRVESQRHIERLREAFA